MRRHKVVMVLAAAAALWCAAPLATGGAAPARVARAAAGAAARAGTWHAAIELPGTAPLNKGGNAAVKSGSGASAGNCAAVGGYKDRWGHRQAFVASEPNGTWHAAIEVPGTAALNKGGFATVSSVSCASAGNCAAGGYYNDLDNGGQAFVASELDGAWRTAIEVPGTAALNPLGAEVASVSCASAGNCAAGGFYTGGDSGQAFVASETNGTWHAAIEGPATAPPNKGGGAPRVSAARASGGNCPPPGGPHRPA